MAVKYVPYFKDPIEGQAILDNFTRTMGVSTNLTRTLMDVVARAEAMKEKEENNNESNN